MDWERLPSTTDEEILPGIPKDPDAGATDAKFWRSAKRVFPERAG